MNKEDFDKAVIFVSGGGTGGHIYPALAVVDELKNRGVKNIYYLGNPKNPEYNLTKEKDIKFLPVNISGMPRKISLGSIFWVIKLLTSILVALTYLLKYKPKMILGTGGYVSAPILFAAKILKYPYMLHDADAQPGIVTRCFANDAIILTTPFESVQQVFKYARIEVTGNPIRKDFFAVSKSEAKEKLKIGDNTTLLIMGGSQGAKSINMAVIPVLKKLIDEFGICIIHQTGKKNIDSVVEMLKKDFPEYESYENYKLLPYIDDMPTMLKASDIAISRSGSLSLSEIMASEVASILVPYPYSSGDHQKINAQAMVHNGCSIMIEDKDLTSEKIYDVVEDLLNDNLKLKNMQNNAFEHAKSDATEKIVENIIKHS